MSARFRRRGDKVRMQLEAWEAGLLRRLRDGLRATLEGADPEDPVIERLFPAAVDGDDAADAELRMLIGAELLTARLEGLDALVEILDRGADSGGRVRTTLTGDEPSLVLGVLNDTRLALGARIGIEDLDRRQLSEDDPVVPTLAIMDHLAGLQEELLSLLDPPSLRFYDNIDDPT